ncbi:hypothetical protein HN903_01200 [archaeon]|jgi:hypothetical protein|nr:hypothetical protein [archaeon]MBT7128348.1 hypothetical protein [archaeon]
MLKKGFGSLLFVLGIIVLVAVAIFVAMYYIGDDEVCGDDVCSDGESLESCAADCVLSLEDIDLDSDVASFSEFSISSGSSGYSNTVGFCGDDVCDAGESPINCSQDCPEEPSYCGDGICDVGEDDSSSGAGGCPEDCEINIGFCGDGVCDANEHFINCSEDCPREPSYCGDGVCDAGEESSSVSAGCPEDCEINIGFCGDEVCGAEETVFNCPIDCPKEPIFCGDGICNGNETSGSCLKDCGSSPKRFGIDGAFLNPDIDFPQIFSEIDDGIIGTFATCFFENVSKTWEDLNYLDEMQKKYWEYNRTLQVNLLSCADERKGGADVTQFPKDVGLFEEWVKYIVKRYNGNITYYQIDTEPSIEKFEGTKEQFVEMHNLAYNAAKRANPDVIIMGSGWTFGGLFIDNPSEEEFDDRLLELKDRDVDLYEWANWTLEAFEYFIQYGKYDAVSIHANRHWNEANGTVDYIRKYTDKSIIIEDAMSGPDYMGILDLPSTYYSDYETYYRILHDSSNPNYLAARNLVEAEQSRYYTKKAVYAFASGMDQIYISWTTDQKEYDLPVWRFVGILGADEFVDPPVVRKKPIFYTYKLMVEKLDGFVEVETIDEFVYKFLFEDKDPVYVLWSEDGDKGVDLSSYLETSNVLVTHLVTVDGEEMPETEVVSASSVPVGDSPIFVEETSAEPTSCNLISASWSETEAVEGEVVSLVVEGSEKCDGLSVDFSVWEDDLLGDDYIQNDPVSVVFDGGRASTSWVAEWQRDGLLGGDPEYYFGAVVDGDEIKSENLLSVSKRGGVVCGDGICGVDEDCPEDCERGIDRFGLHAIWDRTEDTRNLDIALIRGMYHFSGESFVTKWLKIYQDDGIELVLTVTPTSNNEKWGNKVLNNIDFSNISGRWGIGGIPSNITAYKEDLADLIEGIDNDGIDDYEGLEYKVKYIQLGNEPFWQWFGSPPSSIKHISRLVEWRDDNWDNVTEDFGKYIQVSYETIKAADPEMTVVLGAIVGNASSPKSKYVKEMLDDYSDYYDVIDVHYYGNSSEIESELDAVESILPSGKPIWSLEIGGPMQKDDPFDTPEEYEMHAEEVVKMQTIFFNWGAEKSFWSSLIPTVGWSQSFLNTALLEGEEKSFARKPAYYTEKLFVEKTNYFKSVTKINFAESLYEFEFEDKDPVFVLWSEEGEKNVDLTSIVDTDEVLVTHIITVYDEEVAETEVVSASSVSVSETPVFVEEASSPCIDTTWTPAANTVCKYYGLIQTSNCENTRLIDGTKDCDPVPDCVHGDTKQTGGCGSGCCDCICSRGTWSCLPCGGV